MNNVAVSVIIPTFERPELMAKTIRSLKDQTSSGYEIIVVDNACSERTRATAAKEAEDMANLSIKYVQEPNPGLHNARHAGARAARGEILLYVDDDVVADKNLLQEITRSYSGQEISCVGGKILPKWESDPPEWIKLFPPWYLSILDDEDGPKEVNWIYGCNFSIRKDLLFDLGGFNPDAFADKTKWWMRGDGEIGLLRKVHALGKRVVYNPRAVVWHVIPKKRLTLEYFQERAFKSGIEESFSTYRYRDECFSPLRLLLRASVSGISYLIHKLFSILPVEVSIKSRVVKSYYRARLFYDLRLFRDRELQRFVKKEHWLE